jgi:DNA-binding CsgD family transcriptional regulator/PAS domain-containing protein
MATPRSRLADRSLEPFLHALHSSASLHAVQTTCAQFARDLVPAHAYGWYQFKRDTVEPDVISARGVSDRFLALYESEGRARDPIFARVVAGLSTVSSDHHLNARERRAFRFQGEISSGRIARAIQAPLVVAGELLGSINVARDPNAPAFSRSDTERLAVIARHASIAIARAQRERELGSHCTLVEAALDLLGLPLILTGPGGDVIFANRAAGRLLGKRAAGLASGLRTTAEMLASNTGGVATAIVPGETSGTMGSSKLSDLPELAGLAVRSVRLGDTGATVSFLYAAPKDSAGALPALTRREAEIAKYVVRGLSNADIALATSISRNTVKQHLKHVFEKLQVGSRAELAAAVARVEAQSTPERFPTTPFPDDRAEGRSSASTGLSLFPKRP